MTHEDVAPPAAASAAAGAALTASLTRYPVPASLDTLSATLTETADRIVTSTAIERGVVAAVAAGAPFAPAGPSVPAVVPDVTPIIPAHGPYWEGDPKIVPSPATIAGRPVLASAAFAGSQVWAAVCGTYAAQRFDSNVEREQRASAWRGKAHAVSFMQRHDALFAHNPTGARTPAQFHVGFYLVPDIRRLALDELTHGLPTSDWIPWLGWQAPVGEDAPLNGTCYTALCPAGATRPEMVAALGLWPSGSALTRWFMAVGRELGPFWALISEDGARVHVVDHGTPGVRRVQFPILGHHTPGVLSLDPSVRVGGDAAAGIHVATVDSAGTTVIVRTVFTSDTSFTTPVESLQALSGLVSTWRNCRLVRVTARLIGDETGATMHVGLSSPAAAAYLPAGAAPSIDAVMMAEAAIALGTYAQSDAQATDVPLPASCDLELSRTQPPNGGLRPRLSVVLNVTGVAYGALELHLRVGGGAYVAVPEARFL